MATPRGSHQAPEYDFRASGNGPWTNLGGRFQGSVTVVAAEGDRVSVLGLSPEGAVLYKTHAPDDPADDAWQTLGGSFSGPLAAVLAEDGEIELIAVDEDGSVAHRTLTDPHRGHPEMSGSVSVRGSEVPWLRCSRPGQA